jgi:hypothetical protein
MEGRPDIDGLLLDVLELQADVGVHHRSASPTRGPVDSALLQPVQLDAQARPTERRIGQRRSRLVNSFYLAYNAGVTTTR